MNKKTIFYSILILASVFACKQNIKKEKTFSELLHANPQSLTAEETQRLDTEVRSIIDNDQCFNFHLMLHKINTINEKTSILSQENKLSKAFASGLVSGFGDRQSLLKKLYSPSCQNISLSDDIRTQRKVVLCFMDTTQAIKNDAIEWNKERNEKYVIEYEIDAGKTLKHKIADICKDSPLYE